MKKFFVLLLAVFVSNILYGCGRIDSINIKHETPEVEIDIRCATISGIPFLCFFIAKEIVTEEGTVEVEIVEVAVPIEAIIEAVIQPEPEPIYEPEVVKEIAETVVKEIGNAPMTVKEVAEVIVEAIKDTPEVQETPTAKAVEKVIEKIVNNPIKKNPPLQKKSENPSAEEAAALIEKHWVAHTHQPHSGKMVVDSEDLDYDKILNLNSDDADDPRIDHAHEKGTDADGFYIGYVIENGEIRHARSRDRNETPEKVRRLVVHSHDKPTWEGEYR